MNIQVSQCSKTDQTACQVGNQKISACRSPPSTLKSTNENKEIEITNVSSREFHCCISVHVRQQTKAEAFRVGWVGEPIHGHRGLGGVESLPHSLVEFIVGYRAPESWLAVGNRLQICTKTESKVSHRPSGGEGGNEESTCFEILFCFIPWAHSNNQTLIT